MKIWYFHGQYKASGLGTNKISYNIFDFTSREQSSGILSEEIQASKRRKWKNI